MSSFTFATHTCNDRLLSFRASSNQSCSTSKDQSFLVDTSDQFCKAAPQLCHVDGAHSPSRHPPVTEARNLLRGRNRSLAQVPILFRLFEHIDCYPATRSEIATYVAIALAETGFQRFAPARWSAHFFRLNSYSPSMTRLDQLPAIETPIHQIRCHGQAMCRVRCDAMQSLADRTRP